MNFSFEIESLYSPTTINIGVKPKANYRQYLSILPIIRFRLSLGFTAKLKLYSDYPDSDGFFADFLGEVTSESLLAEREGFKPPKRTSRFPDFESGPFGHSGISPKGDSSLPPITECKGSNYNPIEQLIAFSKYGESFTTIEAFSKKG